MLGWEDLVEEFGRAKYGNEIANVFKVAELQDWAKEWVTNRGLTRVWLSEIEDVFDASGRGHEGLLFAAVDRGASSFWRMKINTLSIDKKADEKPALSNSLDRTVWFFWKQIMKNAC
ncbi:MAG: hypothetical protein IPG67_13290 [Acidobacteria bacterium]|nr:hypothetical protein [Acidobacteriota bacterium]